MPHYIFVEDTPYNRAKAGYLNWRRISTPLLLLAVSISIIGIYTLVSLATQERLYWLNAVLVVSCTAMLTFCCVLGYKYAKRKTQYYYKKANRLSSWSWYRGVS